MKLIGSSTDGAPNMAGSISGFSTRLQDAIEAQGAGAFYRVWCLAHQLDIIVKASVVDMIANQCSLDSQSMQSMSTQNETLLDLACHDSARVRGTSRDCVHNNCAHCHDGFLPVVVCHSKSFENADLQFSMLKFSICNISSGPN